MARFDNVIIAADLDGTLFENHNSIPQANLDIIKYFTDNGGKFVIASGRGIDAARSVYDLLPTKTPAIVNNGHTLFDYENDSIIKSHPLPTSAKDAVIELYNNNPTISAEIYSKRAIYVVNPNRVLKNHLDYVGIDYICTCFSDIYALEWNKALMTDEKQSIDNVRKQAFAKTYEDFEFVDTSELFLEMVGKGISKGTALLELADYYGIPHQNTFSIGNYYNDIGLLECACESAVVKNTPDDVAKYASYICEKTANDGAVAEFMESILKRF